MGTATNLLLDWQQGAHDSLLSASFTQYFSFTRHQSVSKTTRYVSNLQKAPFDVMLDFTHYTILFN